MHRNIKKIIAITLAIGAFSVSVPTADFNLMTTKAYAESDDGVQSIRIKSSGGGGLAVYNNNDYKSEHEVQSTEIDPNETYYAKTSSKEVKVSVDGPDSDCVRVFSDTSSSTRGVRGGNSVDISDSGSVIVRIYSTDPGVVKYSDGGYISQYRFKVKYTASDDDEEKDHVFLNNITLSSGDINFTKYTYTYDVNVDEDINKLTIGASPDCDSDEYDYYKVKIDGGAVDKEDKFKDTVNLNKGKNVIEIKVEDDNDNERTYTLNVTRADSSTTNANSTNSNSPNSIAESNADSKTNEWIKQTNGKWQYKDAAGNIAKNTWIQNYYVQADGNMATDWLKIDGSWYYFGTDGAKKTGWQYVSENWYYLDSQGKMQIGWIKDLNGKYYYLNSDGSMAYSTTVNGYKLGADGAWSGK